MLPYVAYMDPMGFDIQYLGAVKGICLIFLGVS